MAFCLEAERVRRRQAEQLVRPPQPPPVLEGRARGGAAAPRTRRSTRVLTTLTRLIAPIVPFLAETMYQNLRTSRRPGERAPVRLPGVRREPHRRRSLGGHRSAAPPRLARPVGAPREAPPASGRAQDPSRHRARRARDQALFRPAARGAERQARDDLRRARDAVRSEAEPEDPRTEVRPAPRRAAQADHGERRADRLGASGSRGNRGILRPDHPREHGRARRSRLAPRLGRDGETATPR